MTEYVSQEPIISSNSETTRKITENSLIEEEEEDVGDIDDFLDNTVIQIPLLNSTVTEDDAEETLSITLDAKTTEIITNRAIDDIGSSKDQETHSGTVDAEVDSDIVISPKIS